MDKNIKYKDYRIGKYLFTVQFIRRYDLWGSAVDVVVWEHHIPRKLFIHRVIDFFKYTNYYHQTWISGMSETVEEFAIRLCDLASHQIENKAEAEKFWEDLDK